MYYCCCIRNNKKGKAVNAPHDTVCYSTNCVVKHSKDVVRLEEGAGTHSKPCFVFLLLFSVGSGGGGGNLIRIDITDAPLTPARCNSNENLFVSSYTILMLTYLTSSRKAIKQTSQS